MASPLLLRLLSKKAGRTIHTSAVSCFPYRSDGWWIDNNKPYRYPLTPEERRDAAKRYGLREEDYKPYHPDHEPTGDYPDLGIVTPDQKDPYENWSYKHFRRNFGEPVSFFWQDFHPYRRGHTGIEPPAKELSYRNYFFILAVWVGIVGFWLYGSSTMNLSYVSPKMPKQFPYDFKRAHPFSDPQLFPILNYSFEPADAPDEDAHH